MSAEDQRQIPSWSGQGSIVVGPAKLGVIDRIAVGAAAVATDVAVVTVAGLFGPPNRRVCETYANLCGGSSGSVTFQWVVFAVLVVWAVLSCVVVRWRWPRAQRVVLIVQAVVVLGSLISTITA